MSGHRRTARRGLRAAVGIGFVIAGVVLAVTGAAGATGDETITAARADVGDFTVSTTTTRTTP
jgi:hypothetical protein